MRIQSWLYNGVIKGILAIGGMAAQIPNDEKANDAALEKVRKDKEREVKMDMMVLGAHPALVAVAMAEFNDTPTPNQLHVTRDDITITEQDLVEIPSK
jgi:malate synthase